MGFPWGIAHCPRPETLLRSTDGSVPCAFAWYSYKGGCPLGCQFWLCFMSLCVDDDFTELLLGQPPLSVPLNFKFPQLLHGSFISHDDS